MTTAKRLNLRLLIDGLEVPVVGARCVFADNADAQADIQVVATDQVYDLNPRSLITLFYYEDADYTHTEGAESGLGAYDPRRWKLLFLGELAMVKLQKQEGQRAAILTCVGPMNYLDFIRQHYLNFRNGGVEFFENAFLGVKADQIKNYDVIGKGVDSNLFVWLSASTVEVEDPETGETEKYSNIYTGTQRLIREMFFASNTFYAQAFNRLRLGDMIVGVPEDKTAAKLMKLSFFQKFIKNKVGGAGGMVSARQMLDLLLKTVLHSATTIPCPRFDPDGKALGLDIRSASADVGKQMVTGQKYDGASLNYVVIKPDTWFLSPPVCNVVFPHQYNALTYQRNYLAEPTRLMLRTSLFYTGSDKWLTERFYAPDFEVINEIMNREGGHLDRMAEVLLGHEAFVGLNPLFTWESDLGAYVQKGARREYLSKLADYLFWKYRFSTRSTNVSGPFNPELVPGYPGLVMDRVGTPGSITRHVMGNIQAVTHSIDQQGGWTHFTMTGCYIHDEEADFDGNGRSLGEVTRRGTDGYLDDRYDYENIGDQVYQTLFGCGSLHDILGGRTAEDISALVNSAGADVAAAFEPVVTSRKVKKTRTAFREVPFAETNTLTGTQLSTRIEEYQETYYETETVTSYGPKALTKAVAYLQLLYQTILTNEGDLQAFTKSLTQRPKADMVQVVGIPTLDPNNPTDLEYSIYDILFGEGYEKEGFLSAAVDDQSSVDDSYTATKTHTNTTKIPPSPDFQRVTDNYGQPYWDTSWTEEKVETTTSTSESTASYGLKEHLEKRQAAVKAYINSLTYQGLRG